MTIASLKEQNKEESPTGLVERASKEFTTQVRVIFADTDKMGIVYHAKYLQFFEIGRNELLRDIGFPYKHLEERDICLPIIEAHLKYFRPAQYDDLLTLKSQVFQEAGKLLRFRIACSVYCGDELLASGFTVHIVSNSQGRPSRPTRDIYYPLLSKLFD